MKLSERLEAAWRRLEVDGDEHSACDDIAAAIAIVRAAEGAAAVRVVSDDIGNHIDLPTWHASNPQPGDYRLVPVGQEGR